MCSALWSNLRVRIRIVPVSVVDPATRTTVPVATESVGAVLPIAASACWRITTACGSRGGGCAAMDAESRRLDKANNAGRKRCITSSHSEEVRAVWGVTIRLSRRAARQNRHRVPRPRAAVAGDPGTRQAERARGGAWGRADHHGQSAEGQAEVGAVGGSPVAGGGPSRGTAESVQTSGDPAAPVAGLALRFALNEIGRASCRERV